MYAAKLTWSMNQYQQMGWKPLLTFFFTGCLTLLYSSLLFLIEVCNCCWTTQQFASCLPVQQIMLRCSFLCWTIVKKSYVGLCKEQLLAREISNTSGAMSLLFGSCCCCCVNGKILCRIKSLIDTNSFSMFYFQLSHQALCDIAVWQMHVLLTLLIPISAIRIHITCILLVVL